MRKFYGVLSFVIVGFILIVNYVAASADIFTEIVVAISEPVALLLFGLVLIGMANVGRKKVFTKENRLENLGMQPTADSLRESDRPEGWYAGQQVSEGLGSK